MSARRVHLPWLIATGTAVLMAGCQSQNSARPGRPADLEAMSGPDGGWPYWPRGMRIHPLTRVAADEAGTDRIIELRIEFTDRDGVECRGTGLLEVDYFAEGDRNPMEPTQSWEIDLQSLPDNAVYYDRVTRTYLLRLEIEVGPPPAGSVLRADFTGVDGWSFRSRHTLRR